METKEQRREDKRRSNQLNAVGLFFLNKIIILLKFLPEIDLVLTDTFHLFNHEIFIIENRLDK